MPVAWVTQWQALQTLKNWMMFCLVFQPDTNGISLSPKLKLPTKQTRATVEIQGKVTAKSVCCRKGMAVWILHGQIKNRKMAAKYCVCLFVCLYLSSLLVWLTDAIHSKILLPDSHLFLHKLVKRIKLLTLSLPRSCWVILLVIYHNPYDVSVENLVLDQLINPWLIFLFILLTCLLDIVSIL